MSTASPPSGTSSLSRTTLVVLLLICVGAIGVVVYLAFRGGDEASEIILSTVEVETPAAVELNVLSVIDTLENPDAEAREGNRYKVLVVDEAREGASGIARIGGLVTFVPNASRGDLVVIEVTRIRRSTADSIVIEQLDSGVEVADRGRPPREPREPRREQPTSAMVGQTYRGVVEDVGRDGDGIVRVDGKVVFVAGAARGEFIEFQVTEDIGRFAIGEKLATLPAEDAARPTPTPPPRTTREQAPDAPVAVGQEYTVEVTDQDRNNPDRDGVARIEGMVIFVPNTQPGDRARIRITEVHRRSAASELLERLE